MKVAYDLFTQVSYIAPMRSLSILLLIAYALPAHAEVVSGPAYAVDGDTLVLNGKHKRLAGIDASTASVMAKPGHAVKKRNAS